MEFLDYLFSVNSFLWTTFFCCELTLYAEFKTYFPGFDCLFLISLLRPEETFLNSLCWFYEDNGWWADTWGFEKTKEGVSIWLEDNMWDEVNKEGEWGKWLWCSDKLMRYYFSPFWISSMRQAKMLVSFFSYSNDTFFSHIVHMH